MAQAGMLTKGIKLGYKASASASTYTNLPNLQTVPSLGGDIDQVETTVLSDTARTYIPGLKDYGDLEFGFVYDADQTTSSFTILKGLEAAGDPVEFEVEFPDGSKFDFTARIHVSTGDVDVGAVILFTCNMSLASDIVYVAG